MNNLYRFIGEDKSMYLIKDQVYKLDIQSSSDLSGQLIISIHSLNKEFKMWSCPYDDYEHFRNNWEVVK